MNENDNNNSITYLPIHSKQFWNQFYRKRGKEILNWYFDLTKLDIPEFSIKNITKDDEVLIIGSGNSSILSYFSSNNYDKITIFDFSSELINILKDKYKNTQFDFQEKDIIETDNSNEDIFDIVIDKGCLDCILSDPKKPEEKFVNALNNILMSMVENGIFYYFSNAKVEDRINLFYKIPGIRYKMASIDMNIIMKEEFREFNHSDNIYYLYIITKN